MHLEPQKPLPSAHSLRCENTLHKLSQHMQYACSFNHAWYSEPTQAIIGRRRVAQEYSTQATQHYPLMACVGSKYKIE